MKYIVRKAFWDYEKEEKWLNEMSAKGWLTDYCGVDMFLKKHLKMNILIELSYWKIYYHAESIAYINF